METQMGPFLEYIQEKGFYHCLELKHPHGNREDWRYPLEGILYLEEIRTYYAFLLKGADTQQGLLVAGNPLQSNNPEIVSKSLGLDIQSFVRHLALSPTHEAATSKNQSEGLARINRVLIENNNANEALKDISGIIRELFKSDVCILFDYQPQEKNFVVNHSIGLPEEASRFLLSLDLKTTDFRLANVLSASPGPVIVEDIPRSNLLPQDIVQLFGLKSGIDIPFRVGDDLLGSLTLFYSRGYHQFTDEQIKMAEEINTLVTVAFENARLFRDRESQTRISKTLVKISRTLTETLEPEEVFKRITRLTRETLKLDYCILLAWDADSDYFVPQYMEGIPQPLSLMAQSERFFREPRQLYRELVRNPEGLSWKRNQDYLPYIPQAWFQLSNVQCIHLYPLFSKDRLLGAIHLGCNCQIDAHDQEWHSLLSGIGQYASMAMENARLHQSSCENTRNLEILLEIAQSLAKISEPELILREVYEQVRKFVHCDCFYIGRIEPNPWTIHVQYLIDEGIQYPPYTDHLPENTLMVQMVQKKEPVFINREREDSPLFLADGNISNVIMVGNTRRKSASLMFVPMCLGDKGIGVMSIQSYKPNAYQQKHLDLISSIAAQLTVALENARNLQEQKKSVSRLEKIASLTALASAAMDFKTQINHILATVNEAFEADCCIIRILKNQALELLGCQGYPEDKLPKEIPANRGIPVHILKTAMPVSLSDINDPEFSAESSSSMRAQSYLGVPIFRNGKINGILAIYTWKTIRNFSDIEIQHLQIVANFLSVTMENARLFDEKRRITERLQALAAIGDMALSHPNKEEMPFLLLEKLVELLHTDAGTLFLLDKTGQYLEVKAYYGYSDAINNLKLKLGEGIAGRVFNSPSPMVIRDVNKNQAFLELPGEDSSKVVSTVGIPIGCSTGTIGVLHLDSFQERNFTDWELSLLEMLGTRVGMILENQKLYIEAQSRVQSLLLLQEFLANDMNILNLDELYHTIPRVACGLVGADYSLLRFYREDNKTMMVNTAWGYDGKESLLKGLSDKDYLGTCLSLNIDNPSFLQITDLAKKGFGGWGICEQLDIQRALMVSIPHDDQGKGLLWVFRKNIPFTRFDITTMELFARQAALNIKTASLFAASKEAQENYRNLFENSNDAVFVIDQNRMFIYANPAMIQLTGYDITQLKKMTLDSLMDFNDESLKDVHPSHLLDILMLQSPREYILCRINGDRIHVEINSRLMHKKGRVFGIQCIVRDITERKRKEKQILNILEFTHSFQLTTPLEKIMDECINGIEKILLPKPYSFIWIALMEKESSRLEVIRQKVAPGYEMDDYSWQAGKSILQETAQSETSHMTVGACHPQLPDKMATTISVPLMVNNKVSGVALVALTDLEYSQIYEESDLQVVELMCNQLIWVMEKQKLYEDLQYQYLQTIQALAKAVDLKDSDTMDHSNQASILAGELARIIDLPPQEVEKIETAALLHDIGKIGIPDEILRKKGPLTDSEYSLVKLHPVLGAEILTALPQMKEVAEMVLHHQEKYDGTGYPDGLKGEAIPLGSRILAIVDAWHAMVSDRYYRRAMSLEEAIKEMEQHAGQCFDPLLLESFLKILRKREKAN